MASTCPHCGCDIDEPPRSVPQHRRFFKIVALAYDNWPESHPFQPHDREHLRAWLLVQAGWRRNYEVGYKRKRRRILPRDRGAESRSLELAGATLGAVTRGLNKHVFAEVDIRNRRLTGSTARSIAYLSEKEMDHFAACRIFGRIDDIVCATLGVESTDRLLDGAKKAA